MNYSRKGVKAKQKALNATSEKIKHKLTLLVIFAILFAILSLSVIGISAGIGMFKGILASTPEINSNDVAPVGAATFVYDMNGNKIDELVATNSNRIMVTMDKIPREMGLAFVAIEDERFYEHNGIDIKGLGRAAFTVVQSKGKKAQGASTITQQLLKNTIFTDWTEEGESSVTNVKKIKRKFQEQYLAIQLTKTLEKDEILERYMNTINLGQNTLGVEAASLRYFGKSVSELNLSECTVIACITQNPSKYNPIRHPDENARRRKDCLDNMLRLEFITQEQYNEALADNVYDRIESHNINYVANEGSSTYFVDALTEDVKESLIAAGYNETQAEFLLYSGGLRIYSTLDPEIQAICDEEVANPENYPPRTNWYLKYSLSVKHEDGTITNYSKEMMMKYFKENVSKDFNLIFSSQEEAYEAIDRYRSVCVAEGEDYTEDISLAPQPQVTVVIMDQSTGYVRAMVGGRGAKEGRMTLNRATGDPRQPGSTFKVLAAYAPAMDAAGFNIFTPMNDAPFNYDTGTPVKNWYGANSYKGWVTVRYAIEQSMNIIAVKTLTQITPQLGYDYLQNFGFTTLTTGLKGSDGYIRTDVRQPLALGGITIGVTNEELTAAYATIANGGIYNRPKLFTKVLDSDGNVIIDNTIPQSHIVLQESTAYLLTLAMEDVVTKGTGNAVRFDGMTIAGKTGTTSDNVDVWFAGYTPYYTCSTWAGYDNHIKMVSSGTNQETGIAKKLWKKIMSRVHKDLPNKDFQIPSDVVQVTICATSGKLPVEGVCPESSLRTEYCAESNVPTEYCDCHYIGLVCAYDGRPASSECPFAVFGTASMRPVEDESLWPGSTRHILQPDGSYSYVGPNKSNVCMHDISFFLKPDYDSVLAQQRFEMEQRNQPYTLEQQQNQAAPNPENN